MDRCKHVGRLRLGQDHSILNPQKWRCVECSTTDSVWACLKCSHVACGRFMEEHSLKHFQESQHPLAMEVRELDVFCFACGDYVLNDNAEGDLKLLRGALSTVRVPGRRSLRSSTGGDCTPWVGEGGPQPAMQLAVRHRRKALLGKMLQTWIGKHQEVQSRRREKLEEARRQKKEVKRRLMEELGSAPPRKSARLLTRGPRSTVTLIPRKFRDPPERLPPPPPPPKKPSLLAVSRKAPRNGRAATEEANRPENRAVRPWIITMGHRPMYCSDDDQDDCTKFHSFVRLGRNDTKPPAPGLEDLFYRYGVDLELWAHEHTYERLWPVYGDKVYNGSADQPYVNPKAPVHIITGSAGCRERTDRFQPNPKAWSAFRSTDYGYSRMHIINASHIYLEQVSDDQHGKVIDSIWVVKEKHGFSSWL